MDGPWFVQLLADAVELARVELDNAGGVNPAYTDVPELGNERLEIQFLEVAAALTRRGIGTRGCRASRNCAVELYGGYSARGERITLV